MEELLLAGHNKWSQIKRKKAINDNARGSAISKHIRAISSAVRQGNSDDPTANLALKNALSAAKSDNVPADNIDKAIDRAMGNAEGVTYDEIVYEGYGPAGVALIVETLTDNKNRTISEVRHVFTKHGGNMSGSTAWQFESKGMIAFDQVSDEIEELAIELGAEDIESDAESTTIYTAHSDLYTVADGFEAKGFKPSITQLTKLPQTETALDAKDADKIVRMVDAFDDLDDVQNVYTTANLDNYSD